MGCRFLHIVVPTNSIGVSYSSRSLLNHSFSIHFFPRYQDEYSPQEELSPSYQPSQSRISPGTIHTVSNFNITSSLSDSI